MAGGTERRPTLADVARRSGMSKSAVSMILNDRRDTRLSAEAAERVRAAADELGYRPNPAARSLRWGKTRTIGFVSDQVTITRYASGMIRGVLDAAKSHGHTVLISETGSDGDLSEAFEELTDRRVDGLLVGLMSARMIEVPSNPGGTPVVVVNGITPGGHAHVLPDEREAGRAVARHLLERGHRRIGVIGEMPEVAGDLRRSATIGDRFAGMDEAFAAAGVRAVSAAVTSWVPGVGYESAHRMLDAHPELTALVAANDNMAFGAYQAMAERGLRVGEDLSVISFDDEELAAYLRPGLTTARLPYEEMARRGVEMLIGDRELGGMLVPMPLVVRDSVRRLPGA